MDYKIAIICESLATMATFIWFLPSVCPHMRFKIIFQWETLVTLTTWIWFLHIVHFQMSLKIRSYEKPLWCRLQMYYISSVSSSRHISAKGLCENAFSNFALMFILSLLLIEKGFAHRLHWQGFSPVCVLIWVASWYSHVKALSQWLHWYGLSPVWVLIWTVRLPWFAKDLLH